MKLTNSTENILSLTVTSVYPNTLYRLGAASIFDPDFLAPNDTPIAIFF